MYCGQVSGEWHAMPDISEYCFGDRPSGRPWTSNTEPFMEIDSQSVELWLEVWEGLAFHMFADPSNPQR